jgi:hypothetical protein
MRELDSVVLRRTLPDSGLEAGDVGAIVHVHPDDSYEVEFVSGEGETVAVVTLPGADLRPIEPREILHVRSLAHH